MPFLFLLTKKKQQTTTTLAKQNKTKMKTSTIKCNSSSSFFSFLKSEASF
jgi:hypothetical protein